MAPHDHHDDSPTGVSVGARKLALVAAINFGGFVLELVGGVLFGSVALLADAMHMLFDMLAYAMAFSARYTAERFYGGQRWSYGLHRLEPVAAFLNGLLLVPMVGFVLYESIQRFRTPVAIDPWVTLAIAIGGLVINLVAVAVLQGGPMSLNERGAFYHLLGDAGGSIVVIVATIAVAVFDLPAVDPLAAIVIAVLVGWSAISVLRESSWILLERSPIPPATLRTEIGAIEGVETVEDLHVWQVCSELTIATVTAGVSTEVAVADRERLRHSVHDRLTMAGVDHATVELYTHGSAPAMDHGHSP